MAYSVATPRCSALATAALIVAMALCVMPHFSYAQTQGPQCNTTLLEAVSAISDLALLAAVIEASGLSNQLNGTDNVTVLAPDNATFNGTNSHLGVLAATNLTLEQVTSTGKKRAASILLYHIIPTEATAAELTNGQSLPTALGNDYPLTVQKTSAPQTTVSFLGRGSNATVISADIRVCNSVVHVINRVLLPAPTLTAIPVYNDSSATPVWTYFPNPIPFLSSLGHDITYYKTKQRFLTNGNYMNNFILAIRKQGFHLPTVVAMAMAKMVIPQCQVLLQLPVQPPPIPSRDH